MKLFVKRSEFRSWLGFINYHIFWTGLVIIRYSNPFSRTYEYGLKSIKVWFGHNDKFKIWDTL